MDHKQAERALGIIRDVIQSTRDDLVALNFGIIWIAHSFTNLAGFVVIGAVVEPRELGLIWYLAPLAGVAIINGITILTLQERDRGIRSVAAVRIHGATAIFILFSIVVAAVLHLGNADPKLFCPLFATTSGICMAIFGLLSYRIFFLSAAGFIVVALVAHRVVEIQWYLLGVTWWASIFSSGWALHREHGRRSEAAKIL